MGNIWKWIVVGCVILVGCGGSGGYDRAPEIKTFGGCMSAQALTLVPQNPLRIVDAADFDGTDYITRGAGLSGVADGKSGILSFWYRVDGGDNTYRGIFSSDLANFAVVHYNNNYITLTAWDATPALVFNASTSAKMAGAGWLHILAAWDAAAGVVQLYVNDVSDVTITANNNRTIDYTRTDWGVGARHLNIVGWTSQLNGCLSEFYFAPNQYLDISNVENRRKFISTNGKPVHLGTDGALPTGATPAIYLHLDDGEAAANFATNRGTGGSFTVSGALTTASTSPSD